MVSRIPPPEDGDDSRPQRSRGALALVLVVAVAAGVWLLNGRDPGTATTATDDTSASAPAASPSAEPSSGSTKPSADPTAGESPGATSTSGTSEGVQPEPSSTQEPEAPPTIDPDSGLPTVYLLDLPPEAAETVEAIERGPPYAYDKDGSTFGNYEGLLPDFDRGYYQEFTVETPGSSDRGARRIVEGADGELYWTDDHYASFSRILL